MPTYYYLKDNKEYHINMTISQMEKFEKQNPDYERIWTPLPIGDPIKLGITKQSGDFREVLTKAKSAHRGSTIDTGNISQV